MYSISAASSSGVQAITKRALVIYQVISWRLLRNFARGAATTVLLTLVLVRVGSPA